MAVHRPNDLEFMNLGVQPPADNDPFKMHAAAAQNNDPFANLGLSSSAAPPQTASNNDPFGNLVMNTAPQRGVVLDNFYNDTSSSTNNNAYTSSNNDPYFGKVTADRAYRALQESQATPDFIKNAKHPFVCIAHVAFKIICLFVYLFGSWIWDGFVMIFIVCIILLAVDFWTVKNVSGRLLVGLRWWSVSRVGEDGLEAEEWVFESLGDERQVDPLDSSVFWFGLYAWPTVWGLFFILNLLKFNFNWLVLISVALVFSGSNLIGFWKCSGAQKAKMLELSSGYAGTAMKNMTGFNLGNLV